MLRNQLRAIYFLKVHWILSHKLSSHGRSFELSVVVVFLATLLALAEYGFSLRSQSVWCFACSVRRVPGAPSTTFRRDQFAPRVHCSDAKSFAVRLQSPLSSLDFSSSYWLGWMVSVVALAFFQPESYNRRSHNHSCTAYWCSHRFVCLRKCFRVRQCCPAPTACYPYLFPFAYRLHAIRSAYGLRCSRGHSFRWICNKIKQFLRASHMQLSYAICTYSQWDFEFIV